MESRKSAIVVLLAWIVASCGSGESHWAGTITDSAGVTIVSNPAVGLWTEADQWTVEEELKIGVVEGDPEYQFGEIGGITVDSRGRMFVLDWRAQHIMVFSAEGVYDQTIGRRGGGPGELQNAWVPLMGAGDTLLVPDAWNQRVNLYAPDGSSVGSFRMTRKEGLSLLYRATSSGVIAKQLRPFAADGQPVENPTDAIVIIATDGTATDTLMKFPSGHAAYDPAAPGAKRLYYPEPLWDLTDDTQIVFGVNDEYRIGLYSANGQLQRIITRQFERKPVGKQDKEAVMGELEGWWVEAGGSAEEIRQLRDRFHFADWFPAFENVMVGPEKTIWVQHVHTASELREEGHAPSPAWDISVPDWDVFDSEGRYLGVVMLPLRFTLMVFRHDKIYGVWRDEFDVQYVLRLRIVGDLGVGAT